MPPVVVAIMWRMIYRPNAGPLNAFARGVGPGVNWLGDFSTALPAVIVVGVWVGHAADHRAAARRACSRSRPSCTRRRRSTAPGLAPLLAVTLPSLRPVIIAITSLNFIWNFNSFGLVYVLTEGGPGRPHDAADALHLPRGVQEP